MLDDQRGLVVHDPDPIDPVAVGPCAPPIKWAGGKAALLPHIVKRLPSFRRHYFEPFAGGGALFFHLAQPNAVLADVNDDLMTMYRALAGDVDGVIAALQRLEREHKQYRRPGRFYYEQRKQWNLARWRWPEIERAAMFLYFNRTCFNGIWRVNRSGGFNVPIGRYKNPTICDVSRLRAASAVLRQSEVRHQPWQETISHARSGDLVYLDPPYVPASATASFTGYAIGGFSLEQQRELAAAAHELAGRGVAVVASNSDTPLVRKLYRGMRQSKVQVSRAISCKGDERGDVGELIICGGFDPPSRRR